MAPRLMTISRSGPTENPCEFCRVTPTRRASLSVFVFRAVCCPEDMVWMVDSDLSPSPEEAMECHITGGFR